MALDEGHVRNEDPGPAAVCTAPAARPERLQSPHGPPRGIPGFWVLGGVSGKAGGTVQHELRGPCQNLVDFPERFQQGVLQRRGDHLQGTAETIAQLDSRQPAALLSRHPDYGIQALHPASRVHQKSSAGDCHYGKTGPHRRDAFFYLCCGRTRPDLGHGQDAQLPAPVGISQFAHYASMSAPVGLRQQPVLCSPSLISKSGTAEEKLLARRHSSGAICPPGGSSLLAKGRRGTCLHSRSPAVYCRAEGDGGAFGQSPVTESTLEAA